MTSRIVPKRDKYGTLCVRLEQMSLGANTSCKDFVKLLEEFGYVIHSGSKHGHKVATHPSIQLKIEDSANFNCGHSAGKKIRPAYIRKFLRITKNYEDAFREYLNDV